MVFNKKVTMKMKVLSSNNVVTRVLYNHKFIKIVHHKFKGEIVSFIEPQLNYKVFIIINAQNTNPNT